MKAVYIPIFILFIIVFITQRNQKTVLAQKLIKRRKQGKSVLNQRKQVKTEDIAQMIELAKKFIGKECLIYSFNGSQFTGTITEVSDGAILVDNGGSVEALNLDFIVRIREYPKNKNGKKKSVVLD